MRDINRVTNDNQTIPHNLSHVFLSVGAHSHHKVDAGTADEGKTVLIINGTNNVATIELKAAVVDIINHANDVAGVTKDLLGNGKLKIQRQGDQWVKIG